MRRGHVAVLKIFYSLQGIIPLLAALLQMPGEHLPQTMRMLRRLSASSDHFSALAQVIIFSLSEA